MQFHLGNHELESWDCSQRQRVFSDNWVEQIYEYEYDIPILHFNSEQAQVRYTIVDCHLQSLNCRTRFSFCGRKIEQGFSNLPIVSCSRTGIPDIATP